MYNLKIRSIAASAATVATFLTLAAATPLRAETVKVPVAYGDLNVQSDAGATELQHRLHRAASLACGQEDAGNRFQVAQCRRDAVSGAKAQLAMKSQGTDVQLAAR